MKEYRHFDIHHSLFNIQSRHFAQFKLIVRLFNDVNKKELCGKNFCQEDCIVKCMLRCFGEIYRRKNLFYCEAHKDSFSLLNSKK